MCWKLESAKVEVVEPQGDVDRRPQRGTEITNETDITIVLRDISRYAWRYDRVELKPGERKVLILRHPPTFFQMGAIKKVDRHEEKLDLYIDADQLVDGRKISICCSSEGEFILREPNNQ